MTAARKDRNPMMIANVRYDIVVAYPTASTETYSYYLGADLMFVATITYTDATKEVLTSLVWS